MAFVGSLWKAPTEIWRDVSRQASVILAYVGSPRKALAEIWGDVSRQTLEWWRQGVGKTTVILAYGAYGALHLLILWHYHFISKPDDKRRRDEQRMIQEKEEREKAMVWVGILGNFQNCQVQECADMGCRLQKYWMKCASCSPAHIITTAPLPKNCSLVMDKATLHDLNERMYRIEHRHVISLQGIDYREDSGHVIVAQPLEVASLRDLIHRQEDPTRDWSEKYQPASWATTRGVPPDVVALLGQHILLGVVYLYDQGFQPLRHIHTGNIFIHLSEEGRAVGCLLGGYENTILSYRPRLYRRIVAADLLERIDVIMFGHVIYELACGRELTGILPTAEEYAAVQNKKLRETLRDIFKLKKDSRSCMKKMLTWSFFARTKEDASSQLAELFASIRNS